MWAIDFIFDETSDRRRLKIATIVDEYTREALAIRVDRTCTAEELVAVIEDLVLTRGGPWNTYRVPVIRHPSSR